jgi:uncharacterized OB-fold protein
MKNMKEFLERLRAGQFELPVCVSCRKKMWPPSHICSTCLSDTIFKKIRRTGRLVVASRSYVKDREGVFGVIDIDGIRIVGSLNSDRLPIGTIMEMTACGVRKDGTPFYDFEPKGTGH